jgi:hypothetical protein
MSVKLSNDTIQKRLADGSLKITTHYNQAFHDVYEVYIDTSGQKYNMTGELFYRILSIEDINRKLVDGTLRKVQYLDMINHDYYEIYVDELGYKYHLDGHGITM